MAKKKRTKQDEKAQNQIGVKDVAVYVSEELDREISPKQLRIYLRDSQIFGEQRGKRYIFNGFEDPVIGELIEYIESKSKKTAEGNDEKPKKKFKKSKKGKKAKRPTKKSKKKAVHEEEDDD